MQIENTIHLAPEQYLITSILECAFSIFRSDF